MPSCYNTVMEKRRFRIGIDARFYGPLGKGLGRYTQEVVDNVLKIDRENEFIIFLSKDNFDEFHTDHPRHKKVLADVRWYSLAEQLKMPFIIKREKIDLMHFPHFNVPIFCPTKFVVTIHDLILTRFPTMRATTLGPILYWIKNMGYRIGIRLAVWRAKKIIAISQYTKNDIIDQFNVRASKIEVTYEGVANLSGGHDTLFAAKLNPDEILSDYCILEPYLLYVGNAYPHKNLEFLIRVFNKLHRKRPELKLVLVGKEDYFYARLKKFAAENHSEAVIFPGYVPDRELEVLFKHAAAYVFPSRYEGFGLPPLEAMSRGCPVISSSATCLPEVLGDAALYINPVNEIEFEGTIDFLLDNETLRQQLIQKGFERVKHYDWWECARLTTKIYERVLETT